MTACKENTESSFYEENKKNGKVSFALIECNHGKYTQVEMKDNQIRSRDHCTSAQRFRDAQTSRDLKELAEWLINEKKMKVLVEPEVHQKEFPEYLAFDAKSLGNQDLLIVIGGDGTLLYIVSLFQGGKSVPPVLSFARGSLGFLTPFQFADYKSVIQKFITPNERHLVAIRMRIVCTIYRYSEKLLKNDNIKEKEKKDTDKDKETSPSLERCSDDKQSANSQSSSMLDKQWSQLCSYFGEQRMKEYTLFGEYHALNEFLLHRGRSQNMIHVNLHVDNNKITAVQSDGLIISTPTGSTAYSVSAGGSLITPNVPCIAITPICPHTLSFRPVIVADSALIYVTVPWVSLFFCLIYISIRTHKFLWGEKNSRLCPEFSFDGRPPISLSYGDILVVCQSEYPVTTFKGSPYQCEWFSNLVEKFNWNIREIQKQIPEHSSSSLSNGLNTINASYSDL
ncbi:hypothetical protein RFI_37206 [Reticulomyxa filosa]|uniref:NAD(+) kinase n=1 Tax=Reticulomyxa filosa TaxID=46433 RepID=X6LF97_RETFI|nr:hypothetical protein RFI_37206 [Reticulomyxa filosa]|eukprot:ETO00249.1 hypothetical protein RFI_37206 [Reticulomyxa filosa]